VIALVIYLITLSPADSIELVAKVRGRSDLTGRLLEICARESRCSRVGVHAIDSRWSDRMWTRAMDRGLLSERCPFHTRGDGWATRGILGLAAAYHLSACAPRWVMDVPIVSAWIGMSKLIRVTKGRALPAGERWAATAGRRAPLSIGS
jgi:hypothetical protein